MVVKHLVLVSHTKSVLGLVEDRLAGAAVNVLVLGAAELVGEGLLTGLLRVWDDAAGDLVGGISEGLTDLLAGGLGGVRLETLLGLGGEIFATEIRHDDCLFGWFGLKCD
jgi:hypothetical protein